MSTVVAKNVQVGTSGTATDNFTIRQPATPDGTVRIANGNSGTTTDLVTVTSAGNVGVGTSSPGAKLDVAATTAIVQIDSSSGTAGAAVTRYKASNRTWVTGVNAVDPTGAYTVYDVTATAERMRIDSSGNVGIGTSTPQAKLAVSNSGAAGLEFFTNYPGGGVGTYIQSFNRSAVAYSNIAYDAAAHAFFTSGTERARIDSSGNLLVGTTSSSPNPGLFVSASGAMAIGNNAQASGWGFVNFLRSGTAIGSITQSGTTAVLYNTTSDQRLKENIQDSASASSLIDAIQVRQYDWKSDGSHQRYGFIAQELVAVAPEAVNQPADPEEMMAVDYSKLVPMLVKEIQSLRARITALESK